MDKIDIDAEFARLAESNHRNPQDDVRTALRIGLWFAQVLEGVSHDLGRIADALEQKGA